MRLSGVQFHRSLTGAEFEWGHAGWLGFGLHVSDVLGQGISIGRLIVLIGRGGDFRLTALIIFYLWVERLGSRSLSWLLNSSPFGGNPSSGAETAGH